MAERVVRRCVRCEEFSLHYTRSQPASGTGTPRIVTPCVTCKKVARGAEWSAVKTDPEKVRKKREQDRRYARSEKGKARARVYADSEQGKAARQSYLHSAKGRDVRRRARQQERARRHFRRQLALGNAKPPPTMCERCHGPPTPHASNPVGFEAHHWLGYDREHWMAVIWLCIPCHRAVDNRLDQEEVRQERAEDALYRRMNEF